MVPDLFQTVRCFEASCDDLQRKLEFALLCQLASDPLEWFTKRELLPTCQLETRPSTDPLCVVSV